MTHKVYRVVDLETSINNTGPNAIGKNKASPYNPDNNIVMFGEKMVSDLGEESTLIVDKTGGGALHKLTGAINTTLLVGHNFKFDMSYMYRDGAKIDVHPIRDWLADHYIWDTQVAEYILTGHDNTYPSLNECADKYGGTLKDERLTIMWKAGVPTEEMMPEMLEEYLEADLDNTDLVFKAQTELAKEEGQLALIRAMNKATVAYTEMEYNGMAVDTSLCELLAIETRAEVRKYEEELRNELPKELQGREDPFNPDSDYIVNFGSPQQMSQLLFGGDFKYRVREKVGVLKNGKDKIKYVDKVYKDPLFTFEPKPEWRTKKYEVYKTGDDVLKDVQLNQAYKVIGASTFIEYVIRLRGADKELSGYYVPIPKLVTAEGVLHQNINNCATKTGRLSQSDPNLQNVASGGESRVKELFISRFPDGVIIDADYKQLEVIALAYLSQDPQLISDIENGVDIHEVTHNKVRTLLNSAGVHKDSQRRKVKGVNFALIYGGGANTISKTVGLPKKLVEAIIDAFYDRYPTIIDWQERTYEEVKRNRKSTFYKTPEGFPKGRSTIQSVTGRKYTFYEYDAPAWVRARDHIDTSFSPTEVKNYPVQGLATGDIVPLVVGELFRRLMKEPDLKDNCLMINTVHDSIIFDCKEDVKDHAAKVIREVMEGAPALLEEVFGITDFDLPLNVDITYGKTWKSKLPL